MAKGKGGAKSKASKVRVPKDLNEVNELLGEIAHCQTEIVTEKTALEESIRQQKEASENEIAPVQKIIDEKFKQIFAYAQANRETLTADGSKTVELAAGVLNWRFTPPAVTLEGTDDEIIAKIRELKLDQFLRVKTEINKEAMLAEQEKAKSIAGVEISQREEFIAKTSLHEIELVKKIPLKKTVEEVKL